MKSPHLAAAKMATAERLTEHQLEALDREVRPYLAEFHVAVKAGTVRRLVAMVRAEPARDAGMAAAVERLRDVLDWIVDQYANQDMTHIDFRVDAFQRATAALAERSHGR